MKKFKSGSFVDFNGVKRNITVCIKNDNIMSGYTLGWSCQNPKDTTDDRALAEKISEARATVKYNQEDLDNGISPADAIIKDPDNWVDADHIGFLKDNEDKFTDFILDIYLDYLIKNPGIMLGGYNLKKKKFFEKKEAEETLSKMSQEDINLMTTLANSTPASIAEAKRLYKYYDKK